MVMDYSGFIYLWTNEIDGKKYLGSHLGTLDDGYIGSGERFLRAVNKYGIENFSREIIEYVKDEKNIRKREQYYLDFYKVALDENFYNISQSACGGKIWQYFDEEKRKEIICRISESNTGSWEDRFGEKEADRRKKEISKRFKGVSKTTIFISAPNVALEADIALTVSGLKGSLTAAVIVHVLTVHPITSDSKSVVPNSKPKNVVKLGNTSVSV